MEKESEIQIDSVKKAVLEFKISDRLAYPLWIREFTDPKAYTGVTVDDLFHYLKARIEAGLASIEECWDTESMVNVVDLIHLRQNLLNVLLADSNLMDALSEWQFKSRNPKTLAATFQVIKETLKRHWIEIIEKIQDQGESPLDVFRRLNRSVAEWCSNEPRPLQVQLYPCFESQCIESHIPMGFLTDPQLAICYALGKMNELPHRLHCMSSGIRDEHQFGLTNFIKTSFGIQKISALGENPLNDDGEPSEEKDIEPQYEEAYHGFRHGSHSVCNLRDEDLRQFFNFENMKQSLAAMLNERLQRDPSLAENQPVVLPISFVSLLSPISRFVEQFDEQQQYLQISDLRGLCRMLDDQILEVCIGGERYEIRPQFCYFNLGVNAVRGLSDRSLEQSINYRGLVILVQRFLSYMDTIAPTDPLHSLILKENSFFEDLKYSPCLLEFNDAMKIQGTTELKSAYQRLMNLNEQLAYLKIKERTSGLSTSKSYNRLFKAKMNLMEEEILPLEMELDEIFKKTYAALKKFFQSNQDSFSDPLKILNLGVRNGEISLSKISQRHLDALTLFMDAIQIFFEHKHGFYGMGASYTKKVTDRILNYAPKIHEKWNDIADKYERANYQFQARFLMLSFLTGNEIEWCCKSGEDRTGVMNDFLNTFFLFKHRYRTVPLWNVPEDLDKFNEIFAVVNNCSLQKYSNDLNSPGERGKKISASDLVILNPDIQLALKAEKNLAQLTDDLEKLLNDHYLRQEDPEDPYFYHRNSVAMMDAPYDSTCLYRFLCCEESSDSDRKRVDQNLKRSKGNTVQEPEIIVIDDDQFLVLEEAWKANVEHFEEKSDLQTNNVLAIHREPFIENRIETPQEIQNYLNQVLFFHEKDLEKIEDLSNHWAQFSERNQRSIQEALSRLEAIEQQKAERSGWGWGQRLHSTLDATSHWMGRPRNVNRL